MIPKHKKLTNAQKRDFLCYCKIMRSQRVGDVKPLKTQEYATCLAHWFVLWDTHGIVANYKNLPLCWRLVQAKGIMNLTVGLWLEDAFHEPPTTFASEIYEWCKELPSWVWKAYINSFERQLEKHNAYVPTYANPLKYVESII